MKLATAKVSNRGLGGIVLEYPIFRNQIVKLTTLYINSFETQLGWTGFLCDRENVLYRIKFGYPTLSGLLGELKQFVDAASDVEFELEPRSSRFDKKLQKRLVDFANGKRVVFDDFEIDQSWMTSFQQRVVDTCRKIPFGQVLSYGELAEQAGAPKAARAVGSVMAKNRFPIIVPCHRVVAAGKRLGGFSAPEGTSLKLRMLQLESSFQTAT